MPFCTSEIQAQAASILFLSPCCQRYSFPRRVGKTESNMFRAKAEAVKKVVHLRTPKIDCSRPRNSHSESAPTCICLFFFSSPLFIL